MTTTELPIRVRTDLAESSLSQRKAKPVKWFAGLGVACLVMQAYVFGRWIFSGNFRPTSSGIDPVPGWMVLAARIHEVLSVFIFLFLLYRFVWKPRRRREPLPLTGMMTLGLMTLYWLDISSNYLNHSYTYNTAFTVNFGAWYNFIPGWTSPRADRLAEPLIFGFTSNVYAVLLPALLLVCAMRWGQRRWPHLGKVGLFLIGLTVGAALDLVLELFWARLGLYAFTGTIPAFTIFRGHYYQFPLYEPILAGLYWMFFVSLMYFRDDKGRCLVERGLDEVTRPDRQKSALRFLAWAGACNLALLSYSAVWAFHTVLPSFEWNDDTANHRSYLRDELCGPGTTYACPSSDIPLPRGDHGLHVDPERNLVGDR